MVEGSLWVYGHTDLTDYYRGVLTLRQVYVRIRALPAEAPLIDMLQKQAVEADAGRRELEIASGLEDFKRRWGRGV